MLAGPLEIVGGRFRIEELAGKGGMGTVYRAHDLQRNERVALKIVTDEVARARFQREASVLASLEHPGIVRYVAHGVIEGGGLYLAMEWLEGVALDRRLRAGPFTIAQAVVIAQTVARALSAAHAAGIVHRDVKPSNIILRDGDPDKPVLVDFGIARTDKAARTFTATGVVIGTPAYMAPEQARAESGVDARADLFSLGCVLFECLCGRPPFLGEHVIAILAKILLEPAPRVRLLRPEVPPVLDALVAKLLEKSAAKRPASASEVAEALGGADEQAPVENAEPRAAIGVAERRYTTVLLARALANDGFSSGSEDSLAGLTDESQIAEVASSVGMSIAPLADGMFVGSLGLEGDTDTALRAARCAIALRERLPHGVVALATGRAIVASEIPVGDAIDRAAALLAKGRSEHGVWIDDATADLIGLRFDLDREKNARVLVRERERMERTVLGKVVPFVGRERELALLEATYRECTDEPIAHATILIAPPGTGKTRLQRELVARVSATESPPEVWLGQTDPIMHGAAFALAGDVFRRVIGLSENEPLEVRRKKILARTSTARIAAFLGEIVGAPFEEENDPALRAARRDPELLASQVDDAVVSFVHAELAAKKKTLLLILEDVHWADAASLRLFATLLSRSNDRPLMILALARRTVDETHPKLWEDIRCQRLTLEPLLRKAAERLARAVLGDRPEVDAIVRRAAGNALFVEELARACAEGRAPDELPPTIAAAAEARLGALDADTRQVLRASAIFGERFWMGGVAKLLGTTPIAAETRLARLVELELVSDAHASRFADEREYVFRHALVRDAAYAMLTDEDRRLGHGLAGEWLEQRVDDAALLAHHYELGERHALAARWHVKAAENALAANDFGALAAHVAKAEACGASGAVLGAARLAAAEGAYWKSDYERTSTLGRDALSLLEPGTVRWFEAIGITVSAYGRLEENAAVRDVALLLDGASASDARTGRARAIARARAVSQLSYAGERELADRLFEGCENEPGAAGDPAVLAWIANAETDRRSCTGAGGLPSIPLRAMELYEQIGDRKSAMVQAGMYALTLDTIGESELALKEVERLMAEAAAAGLPTHHLVYAQKVIHATRDAHAGKTKPVLEAASFAPSPRGRNAQRVMHTVALANGGLWDEMPDLDEIVAEAARTPVYHPIALSVQARTCAARGDGERAIALATEALERAKARGVAHWGVTSVDIALVVAYEAANRPEDAARAAREGLDRLLARGMSYGEYRASYLERAWDSRMLFDLARKYGITGE